jgi:hypothetical protein
MIETAMYPAGSAPKADGWTTDTYMKAAEACHKAGVPFGVGLGQTSDSVDTAGAFFQSFGAELVNVKGDLTVKSDAVKQALEYCKRVAAFYPPDAPAWDDASNNKWLVAGNGALIMNPPSAWAVAKRDAPQIAEQCWTHGFPAGPKGRFAPFLPFFWGIWSFSKNQPAGKSLLAHLSQASSAEKRVIASGGYDLPSFEKLTTCIKEGLQAFVDGNLNRNSTRLVGDKCSQGQKLSAVEPKRSGILASRVADVDSLLKINRTLIVRRERRVASSEPTQALGRMAIGARYVRGPILSAPQPFPVQHREHSWIDGVIVLDRPRFRAHELVI